jgi:hypothetical protein
LSGLKQLFGAARGADLYRGVNKELHIRIGKYNGTDVTAVKNCPAPACWRPRKMALECQQLLAHGPNGGDF